MLRFAFRGLGFCFAITSAAQTLAAQTLVDLRTQGKSVDFANVATTRPVKTGTTLPASCAVGEMFFKSNAPAGQNLYACYALNSWSLTASSTQAGQLLDLVVSRASDTLLTAGDSCQVSTPCNVRVGNTTYSITSRAEITLQNGTGRALIYISGNGVLTVGHNITLSCDAGCTAVSGVTDFPANSIPIATWTSNSGVWDPTGGMDRRAFQSNRFLVAGTGIITVESAGQTTVSVDQAQIGVRVSVPATATTTCTSGSWAADSSFFYICHSTNTWKRTAISTW